MRRGSCGVVVLALVCGVATPALADGDGRVGDRFFFGGYGGGTDGGGAGGYEVSSWPIDYLGITAGTSVVTAGQLDAMTPSSTTFDWGFSLVGAIPLRYIQPYAGGWAGFARTSLAGVGTGFHMDFHPVAGVNGYVSRNLRLYVQWRPVTVHHGIDGMTDPTTDVFELGLRWSPDAFHRARAINKLDLVWGSVSLSCVAWLMLNLFQHMGQNASQ